jgi:hypothetical protein
MRIPHLPFSDILHLIEVAAIVSATIFAAYQLRALRLQSSADLTLRLGQELDAHNNQRVSDALDSDPTTPILKRPKGGGKLTVLQLDNYLAEYETLDDLYRNGLITCPMM